MNKLRVLRNVFYLSVVMVYGVITFFVVANFGNVLFAIQRPDLMSAVQVVARQEQKEITKKIAEAKRDTTKKILSPLVTNNSK
jgi:hypothetical protein